jgi:hypothetical protein
MYVLPAIGTKGVFTFAPPFDTKVNNALEYTVSSMELLSSIYNDGRKPFDTIYKMATMTEEDYAEDIKENVFIVGFTSSGCETFYVPSDRIKSSPRTDGYTFVGKALAISLGNVPLDLDLSALKSILTDTVYDAIGIRASIQEVLTSAGFKVSEEEYKAYMLKLANAKKVDKSFKTLYLEEVEKNRRLTSLVNNIEACMKDKCGN